MGRSNRQWLELDQRVQLQCRRERSQVELQVMPVKPKLDKACRNILAFHLKRGAVSRKELAHRFNVTPGHINFIARQEGIYCRVAKITDSQKCQIFRMWRQGLSHKEIGLRCVPSLGEVSVRNVCIKAGLRRRKRKSKPDNSWEAVAKAT